MNTERHLSGEDKTQQQTPGEQSTDAGQENVEISLPKIDRPEGPFEHSGDTARRTSAEEDEAKDKQQEGGGNQ